MNYKKNNLDQLFTRITFVICGLLIIPVSSQDSSNITTELKNTTCKAEIIITTRNITIPICLDNFAPEDSCAEVDFFFKKPIANITFYYGINRHWNCTRATIDSNQSQKPSLDVSLSYDKDGFLEKATFHLDAQPDSSNIHINLNSDVKSLPDSINPLDYEINRHSFTCKENIIIGKMITDRVFTYPGGYMQRGPILNYPELSAFHWGPSVKMPNSGKLQERAFMMNYWHLQTPPPIEYDDPEILRKREIYLAKWRERRPIKKKKERDRKPFLIFKPL